MCGSTEQPVYVHGHSQCATCKINIDPCCGGAPLDGLEAARAYGDIGAWESRLREIESVWLAPLVAALR